MRPVVVLRDLGELGAVRDLLVEEGPVPAGRALVPVIRGSAPADREALAAEARGTLEQLERLLESDGARRREAASALDRVREASQEATRLRGTAREMREASRRASGLAGSALEPETRRRAERSAAEAGRLATRAEAHAAVVEAEARRLSGRADVARLLGEERSRREEARMREEMELAGSHLDGGRYDEARRLLDEVERNISSAPDLGQAFETLRRREGAVKIRAAETALAEARRLHRREPARAIEVIESAPLEGVPEELARHLYGCWLAACRRLGLLAAIHYRAGPCRGAVLMPALDGRWEVVSALGMRRWERGRRFAPRALRGARALA
ncbi:MAG: hypothetical protein F4150_01065 [Chloroflexi bacterium]|nr:hypothetical protein [Chloroflexota bacterium]